MARKTRKTPSFFVFSPGLSPGLFSRNLAFLLSNLYQATWEYKLVLLKYLIWSCKPMRPQNLSFVVVIRF